MPSKHIRIYADDLDLAFLYPEISLLRSMTGSITLLNHVLLHLPPETMLLLFL